MTNVALEESGQPANVPHDLLTENSTPWEWMNHPQSQLACTLWKLILTI